MSKGLEELHSDTKLITKLLYRFQGNVISVAYPVPHLVIFNSGANNTHPPLCQYPVFYKPLSERFKLVSLFQPYQGAAVL